jgi:hypothetical protein
MSVSSLTATAVSAPLDRLAGAGSRARVVPVRAANGAVPRVTVVIPCFNYGHYLAACVEGILAQPGVAVDVIVVDDASTDGSAEVAAALAAAHPAVRLIRHRRNAGHIATYNDGLAEATGDYVVLLSADDLLTPGALGRATAVMQAHPSVGMVYGHAVRFSGAAPPPARTRPSAWLIWPGRTWLQERFRTGRNCILSPEVVLRTDVQRTIGGYRPDLPHTGDLEMWMRAASVADVGFVCGADQAWYREHATNMHATAFQHGDRGGMVVDLRERVRAFEVVAGRLPAGPDAARMLMSARRAVAVDALTLAIRSFYWGVAGDWPVAELRALAADVFPGARRLPQWQLLDLHQRIGTGWPQRNPLSLSHRAALKARHAGRQWRWARAGR